MTEKNKAMAWEMVWKDLHSLDSPIQWSEREIKRAFDMARIGYIPADRAIEVPDDWPEWAECAVLVWCKDFDYRGPTRTEFAGVRVPRPVPAFVPRINDMVFFIDHKGHVDIGRIVTNGSDGSNPSIRRSRNVDYYTQVENVKKFDPSKIGLPWSEI